jgi:hypothetical protein
MRTGREGLEPDDDDTRKLEEATPPVAYHDGQTETTIIRI